LLERHGVREVLVNLHYAHERVREFLASYRTPLAVTAVYEERLLGSAGTVVANRGFVDGDPSFLILYADNLTNVDLGAMIRFHERRDTPLTIGVVPTDRPKEKGTVVLDADQHVLAFVEKSPEPPSNLSNAGVYVAGPELFAYVPDAAPSDGVLDFGYHVFPRMVPRVSAYRIDDFLMDIGTPEQYEIGQRRWPGLA
jgi:mannose-1-phosphate guanylyltransferase